MNRSADLHTYLLEAASTPFAWRDHDCCSFAADWCLYSGHEDPMARWRESYEDEAGARLLFTDPGEFLSLWELGMIDAAIPECDEPRIGDVAVVLVRGEQGVEAVGGIYGGRRYHMLSPNGLYAASIEREHVLKTWRV